MTYQADVAQSDLPALAERVISALRAGPQPFCLWLVGDLGAGKTTFTRHLLRTLGVPAQVPITSPTYTYMNEYRTVSGEWFAHLDLYRAGPRFNLEDLGLLDAKQYAGFFIEWPSAIPKNPAIAPTQILTLAFGAQDDVRSVCLESRQ